ncbi:MAG: hypothetical protein ACKO01_12835, partial [Erythrobacter sp.]
MGDISSEFPRHAEDVNWSESDSVFHPLVDDLMAIAARLKDAAEGMSGTDRQVQCGRGRTHPGNGNHLALARKAYALRRKR